jgi:CheY-like chemotaxis protein
MQFLSHVSHEIRTPMNAIITLSGLAAETELNEQQRQYLNAIEQSSKDLLNIINQLLDHSKMESGMFSFSSHPFALQTITGQLEAMLRPLAQQKNLQLEIQTAPDVPAKLKGDRLRLTQILTNLIGNAIKFTEEGYVRLQINANQLQGEKAELIFVVSDTGIGIPEDKLEHVFDRFIDDQNDIGAISTGLGLYITQQLVQRQGGTITVESKVNTGTQVTVKMPFEFSRNLAKLRPSVKPDDTVMTFGDIKILIVDDSPFNLLVISEMIKKRIPHALVVTAESGKEALEHVQSAIFDIIVMDAKMPGMDGHETTQMIRNMNGDISTIPILCATAGAMPSQIKKIMDSGMNDVITKPIEVDELMKKLFDLTQQRTK